MNRGHIRLILWLLLSVFHSNAAEGAPLSLTESYREAQAQYETLSRDYERLQERARLLDARASIPNVQNGRLTVTTNLPVTTADTTTATVIYFTPYRGNLISLYWRGGWRLLRFSEVSLNLATAGIAANNNYDVFAYRTTAGGVALELSLAWTNTTTRNQALTTQDGILVKSADTTRRYLGTLRTNTAAVQVTDSIDSRHLWNYYNRVPRNLRALNATNGWNYNANAWRQANADATNQGTFVIGINEVLVRARVKTNTVSPNANTRNFTVGIGVDSTTANSALLLGAQGSNSNQTAIQAFAEYMGYVGIGMHTLSWIESCPSAANSRSWGDNGAAQRTRSGIKIIIEG